MILSNMYNMPRKARKRATWVVECDVCFKQEVGRRRLSTLKRLLIVMGWFIEKGAVVCPQCRQALQED